ncbi:Sulfatase [Rubrobacter radiotolerans]|uniref:Sulfatase n=1 Tax=Rubrobacter radiotolerans TaxID=42256 RepID=A0A023X5M3_RUBRA|nr:sulfatase [Rubrobacter radiotolerans]AHY47369.1 Sulfatase [Rubrobacter radiotolerans]MDX5894773.1 sulfatase [Rubrobacter radiotolerans]SMC06739.1 Arylsulfatase A [Rubrobacter radiotolerans DSM 5868]
MKPKKLLRTALLLPVAVLAFLVLPVSLSGDGGPAAVGQTTGEAPAQTPGVADDRPNFVLILTDDMTLRDYFAVREIESSLGGRVAFFENSFVTTSLCCPSRASTLLGTYVHNHGIKGHIGPNTGEDAYSDRGYDRRDLPSSLKAAGYETALFGKYLNKYTVKEPKPPGWDEWYAGDTPARSWKLNENGKVFYYQQERKRDPGYRYWEDMLGDKAVSYINGRTPQDAPFFLWLGTHAPHGPEIYPPRHARRFQDARLPKPPNFNEADVSDKPEWIRSLKPLTSGQVSVMEQRYRDRLRALAAVSDNIARIRAALRKSGELDNTYFIFTSDNGYHLGNHRLGPGKMTGYEEDARVPLAISGPSVVPGKRSQLVANIDLAPTVAELAGARLATAPDGRSLAPLLTSGSGGYGTADFRKRLVLENYRVPTPSGMWPAPTNQGIRGQGFFFNRYATGEEEYYNLQRDPHQLRNRAGDLPRDRLRDLRSLRSKMASCKADSCRSLDGGKPR